MFEVMKMSPQPVPSRDDHLFKQSAEDQKYFDAVKHQNQVVSALQAQMSVEPMCSEPLTLNSIA